MLGGVRFVRCSRLGQYGWEATTLVSGGPSESLRRVCSLKALFVEFGPVGNASVKEADMDEVKVVWRVDPFATAVVDLEVEVLGRSCLVGWGEVTS